MEVAKAFVITKLSFITEAPVITKNIWVVELIYA